MATFKDTVIEYGKIAWKWIRFIFRTRAAAWAISTFLVPLIVSYAASQGIVISEDMLKIIISEITGIFFDPTMIAVGIGAGVAATGAAVTAVRHKFGTNSAVKERVDFYQTKYDEAEANQRIAEWIGNLSSLRKMREAIEISAEVPRHDD